MTIQIDSADRSLRAMCLRYIRADADDVGKEDGTDADPPWDDVLVIAEEPVAYAWLAMMDAKWADPNGDWAIGDGWGDADGNTCSGWGDVDGGERPRLLDVIDNGMASDWLIDATLKMKMRLVPYLDRAIVEYQASQ